MWWMKMWCQFNFIKYTTSMHENFRYRKIGSIIPKEIFFNLSVRSYVFFHSQKVNCMSTGFFNTEIKQLNVQMNIDTANHMPKCWMIDCRPKILATQYLMLITIIFTSKSRLSSLSWQWIYHSWCDYPVLASHFVWRIEISFWPSIVVQM